VVLILAHSDDVLARNVYNLLKKKRGDVQFIDESTLFSRVQMSLHRHGQQIDGFLRLRGKRILLTDLSGVLLRLHRTWWPSPSLDLQDQVFIYHETIASWFSLFATLTCPVINRFPLGWWLQEVNSMEMFRLSLAARLHMRTTISASPILAEYGLHPTPASSYENMTSYYIAGNHLIPSLGYGRRINTILSGKFPAIASWLEHNGITLCRLDFESNGTAQLCRIEPSPVLENEPTRLINKIGKAIARRLF